MTAVITTQPSRRTLVKGAAWSVPVISAAAAAPAHAASCVTDVMFPVTAGGNPAVLNVYAPDGTTVLYTVTITSVLGPDTTTTQSGTSYNMNTSGNGWHGGHSDDGSLDFTFNGFGPAGALVLNQRRTGTTAPTGTATDSQTLTFLFADGAGVPFDPTSFSITVFDISSALGGNWRRNYWDAVGFSQTPTSITPNPGTAAGVGSGTTADPYHRATGHEPTPPTPPLFEDKFTFASFPSGSTMTYTQHDSRTGWHFISISGISFTTC